MCSFDRAKRLLPQDGVLSWACDPECLRHFGKRQHQEWAHLAMFSGGGGSGASGSMLEVARMRGPAPAAMSGGRSLAFAPCGVWSDASAAQMCSLSAAIVTECYDTFPARFPVCGSYVSRNTMHTGRPYTCHTGPVVIQVLSCLWWMLQDANTHRECKRYASVTLS